MTGLNATPLVHASTGSPDQTSTGQHQGIENTTFEINLRETNLTART